MFHRWLLRTCGISIARDLLSRNDLYRLTEWIAKAIESSVLYPVS